MKYIRTKDGIFEDEYVHIKVDKDGYAIMEYKSDFYEAPEKVKLADTIEELCDEFVWKAPNNHPLIVPNIYNANIEKEIKNGRIIYGAIWTDKGLIYVAKMNDKGELELL